MKHGIVLGLMMGVLLIVLGLIPGLFQDLAEGLRNFADSLSGNSPRGLHRRTAYENRQRPIGLTVAGALMIALSVYAYFSA